MSIGLSDLGKKKKRTLIHSPQELSGLSSRGNSSVKPAGEIPVVTSADSPSTKIESVYKKSITARPWTDSGVVRAVNLSRPRLSTSDLNINDEWMSLQTEPIFWIDFREHSTLLKLNETLSQIETKIEDMVITPLRALKNFIKPRHSN